MNKQYNPLILHIIFWVTIAASFYIDMPIQLLGANFSIPLVLTVVFFPIVIIFTWRARDIARARLLRDYYSSFRWVGIVFWAFSIFWVWMSYLSRVSITN